MTGCARASLPTDAGESFAREGARDGGEATRGGSHIVRDVRRFGFREECVLVMLCKGYVCRSRLGDNTKFISCIIRTWIDVLILRWSRITH